MPRKTFGKALREKRIEKGYTLRKFALLVGVSPTYLSQVEQENVDPPTADRVKRMAEILGEDVDEWTALAGRLTEDLPEIIHERPKEFPDMLRDAGTNRRSAAQAPRRRRTHEGGGELTHG